MRRVSVCLLALAAVLAVLLALPRGPQAAADARAGSKAVSATRTLAAIKSHRAATWRWQKLMGTRLTPSQFSEIQATNVRYLDWLEGVWKGRAHRARRKAARPPHMSAWLCIHRYERHPGQGWATETGNGYYGGLQMNLGFQRRYGSDLLRRKGTADRWTRLEQMWVAERAHRAGRGFYPWPNTARACGLL
jgi:Transglycosylase-like domain